MAARGHAAGPAESPRCAGNNNGTCAEQLGFPPFSSTLALIVLVLVLVGIVLVSLATFHLHKRKLHKRKILRAQEEYERDRRSPARASANELVRPSVIVRPLRSEERPRGPSGGPPAEGPPAETQGPPTQGLGPPADGPPAEGLGPPAESPPAGGPSDC
ncbi:hypothetical protein NL108_017412 [Boleophthalmus pectinirostris]|uniref:uncharacterized protein C11orf87 homolog n=1 Tax=Boleophthalmus pectinirostris TaxID=150288 RepID=UPI0024304A92|nr:uncharacterized protein C11orf87 homolog [Boleophthalmus pectinirostris]KAJ0062182.1 hypothetical protein NL108_017412 [Boleophthalmus pectinirostris]